VKKERRDDKIARQLIVRVSTYNFSTKFINGYLC